MVLDVFKRQPVNMFINNFYVIIAQIAGNIKTQVGKSDREKIAMTGLRQFSSFVFKFQLRQNLR